MYWKDLEGSSKIKEVPEPGTMLIYTRTEVIFKPYQFLSDVENQVKDQEILEVHLFDKEKEYRALSTQSKRFTENFIDDVFRAGKDDKDTIYSQEIMLEQEKKDKTKDEMTIKKIQVNNHISYNETGMAVIDNYRLVEVE